MTCANCVEEKDKPYSYKKCDRCGKWCPLTAQEKAKVKRRAK